MKDLRPSHLDFNVLDVVSYQQLLALGSSAVVDVIGELGARFDPDPDNYWSWVFVNVADPDNVDTRPFYPPLIQDTTHTGTQGVSDIAAPMAPYDHLLLLRGRQ